VIVYDSTVSERYALALFNVAKRQGNLDGTKNDAEQFLVVNRKDSKLAVFLEGPQFTTESKLALVNKLFAGKIEPIISQLLVLLIKKGRIGYARPIFSRFIELAEMDQGIRHAEVATAADLTADQKSKIQQALEAHTNSKLRLNYRIEPALIAGVRFTMGDLLIDDSVKGKLEKLRFQLQGAAKA
jgi:F-type H+-transporting ATPase subunit delta